MSKRLPAPWIVIEHEESFEVQAANGVHVAFVYFEEEITRRQLQRRMTRADARFVAERIARLPGEAEEASSG
jgi:hypothetical protein